MTQSHFSRRDVLRSALALAAAGTAPNSLAWSPQPFPSPDALQEADLIWPKKPGAFVPYGYRGAAGALADETEWEAGKAAFLAGVVVTMENVAMVNELANLSYAKFRRRYLGALDDDQTHLYSYGPGSMVGHVAMVHLADDGVPWIIEAMPESGVAKLTYEDWLAARPSEIAWHGRLKDTSAAQRRAITDAAQGQLGAPYDFWKLQLDDGTGFYCSKLVWFAIMQGASLPVDGNPDPNRFFWLSPKQLLNAPTVDILLDQGDYAFD